jgi:plasmid stabilization system protein ParE
MSCSLRLHPAAQLELAEITAYYEAESVGLGETFLAEVQRAFAQIVAFPEAFPAIRGPVRVRVLAAFPYSVHYSRLDSDTVLVLALAHQSRRPFYWHERQ